MKPSIPKGTRDFSSTEVANRNYIFNTIRAAFETFGFQPIETPSFENSSTLMGKYGEEGDRLIFKILNSGDYLNVLERDFFKIETLVEQSIAIFRSLCRDIDKKYDFQLHSYKSDDFYLGNEIFELYSNEFENIFSENYKNYEFFKYFSNEYRDSIINFLIESILISNQTFNQRMNSNNNNNNNKEDRYIINEEVIYSLFKLGYYNFNKSNKLTPKISEKALRYDLTVPFARYVVQHQNDITFPFKRYQIQPVWRADRPQKGRFREFYQCDADVVGSKSLLQEVEFVQLYDTVFSKLNLVGTTIKINNRKILSGIAEVIGAKDKLIDFTVALDKLDKIGKDGVVTEMLSKGITEEAIEKVSPLFDFSGSNADKLNALENMLSASEEGLQGVEELRFVCDSIETIGLETASLEVDVTLARGLNYYTGAIYEVAAPDGVKMGSIGGGGRYDDLTGVFGLKDVSGVGISFGLDRIYLVLEELGLFESVALPKPKVLFLNFDSDNDITKLKAIKELRKNNVKCEIYPDVASSNKKEKKQWKYVATRGIEFVVSKIEDNQFVLKKMSDGEQKTCSLAELINTVQ